MARRKLEDGIAIVTGASSGIGRELALQLADQRVSMLLNSRRPTLLQAVADEVRSRGAKVEHVAGDIAEDTTRRRVIDSCVERFGGLDFLINNAGISAMGPFAEAEPSRLDRIMAVNFFAPAELIRLSIPWLRKSQRAIIVNIGSVLGHRAVSLKSEYCASKFALHGLSDAIRAELASDHIDLLLVSPSTTDSNLFEAALEDETGIEWKGRRAASPARVAQKTLQAMKRGAHEIILTPGGKALVWIDRLAPTLANRLVQRGTPRRKKKKN